MGLIELSRSDARHVVEAGLENPSSLERMTFYNAFILQVFQFISCVKTNKYVFWGRKCGIWYYKI